MPRSYRFQKESEFIRLEQGTATVVEHEARFTALSRYTPDLVRTEDAKMRRFLESLNLPIRHRLTIYDPPNYIALVEKAKKVEKDVLENREQQSQYKRARVETFQSQRPGGSRGSMWSGQGF